MSLLRSALLVSLLCLQAWLPQVLGDCSACSDEAIDLATCFATQNCSVSDCLEGDAADMILGGGGGGGLNSCCPDCAANFTAATTCFSDCLPDCVFTTVAAYQVCLRIPFNRCENSCEQAVDSYQNNITASLNQTITVIDIVNATGGGDREVDVEFNLPSDENVTCGLVLDKVIDLACEIASCCTPCLDEFEDIVACAVNEVLFPALGSNETCEEIDGYCSTTPPPWQQQRQLMRPRDPPNNHNASAPPFGQSVDAVVNMCGSDLVSNLALSSSPASSVLSFLECVLEANFRPLLAAGMMTDPPTSSPTESATESPPPTSSAGSPAAFGFFSFLIHFGGILLVFVSSL